jgi:hypothetical protein
MRGCRGGTGRQDNEEVDVEVQGDVIKEAFMPKVVPAESHPRCKEIGAV